jgi:glutamine amidotransferase|tara:strand:+ start:444 stop:1091 length:648 start_codon:yes stop_codon:yes gene_type:complete
MNNKKVTVIDLGIGNLFSIVSALKYCGSEVVVTSNSKIVENSSLIILPGDGAFKYAMTEVKERGLLETLKNINKTKKKLLGICIGMQILFDYGLEHGKSDGLGLISGSVVPIPSRSTKGSKVTIPHIGWNSLVLSDYSSSWEDTLLKNNKPSDEVYFIHSFMATPSNNNNRIADCIYYGHRIAAVVKNENIVGCQFHPEKSGKLGLKILKEFIKQ